MTIDFTNVPDHRHHASGVNPDYDDRPRENGKLLTDKQIRARARRRAKRLEKNILTDTEMAVLYKKPIEEWDLAELAHGRPKNSKGTFSGPKPKWISNAVHEQSMELYTAAIKTSMRATTVDAVKILNTLINDESVDEKGKPVVAASTKIDAAKFLIEHVVGKPQQTIKSDISVKLQGILAQVMVNPSEVGSGQELAHFPGLTFDMQAQIDDEDLDEGGEG